MTTAYKIRQGSLQERFFKSRAKIQFYGGGFANGKTSAVAIRALELARDYPGGNFLLARSTYPKLNDTLRKEFLKWCPAGWIKQKSEKPNNVVLTNGTTINFRYLEQQGKSNESTTSNLLSATYDLIIVDQMEDPEINHKDFLDLLGRLRGMTRYQGSDPTMPNTGPRWMLLTSNPTRNWVYHELIKPLHDYKAGRRNTKLLLDQDTQEPMIELFEGSTYENKDNLEPDFIKTLEAAYTGQMKERFLMGKWGAYEGLVYPQFDDQMHMIPQEMMHEHVARLRMGYVQPTIIQGYDYGQSSPSCYLIGLIDQQGFIYIVDGFYQADMQIHHQANAIKEIRNKWGWTTQHEQSSDLFADPQIFKKTSATKTLVGQSVSDMFGEENVIMRRGNNDILSGIVKVRQYLTVNENRIHPLFGTAMSPKIMFSSHLEFISNEFSSYRWKKNTSGETEEVPVDRNDHAMDTIKYILSEAPPLGKVIVPFRNRNFGLNTWAENADPVQRKARHG
jgi:phage terminase large subunit